MSIIVKGMKMPKSCSKCRWFDMGGGYGYQCTLLHKSFDMWNEISAARDKDCPLIEVPPHGRLIDADFEEQHYTSMTTNPTPDVTEQDKHNSLVIVRALQMAKTIIEAED